MSFSDDDPEGIPDLPMFPERIYPGLPSLLKEVTDLMITQQEKSLVLIGSIVTVSAGLLPLRTIYFGKTIFPNCYLFVPGPAGAGKGKLDFCYRLVKSIHMEKRERWLVAKEEYTKEVSRYKRQRKGENIDPPVKPPIQLLRIPANSSATSFQQAMAENGNLLMFETEGDTVVNAFSGDYSNYSDAFRKAFAHESFGYLRRGDDGEEREIDNPRLSTVLSGTPEQVKSLIRDAENGLLSRFMFFCIITLSEQFPGLTVTVKLEDLLSAGRKLCGELLDYIAQTRDAAPSSEADTVELLTTEETCRKLGVSTTTLWRMAQSGILKPVKVGVQNRYRLTDIAALVSKKGGAL